MGAGRLTITSQRPSLGSVLLLSFAAAKEPALIFFGEGSRHPNISVMPIPRGCPALLIPWPYPCPSRLISMYFFLQGKFLTQGLNSRLLHWQDSSSLSHLGCSQIINYSRLITEKKKGVENYSILNHNSVQHLVNTIIFCFLLLLARKAMTNPGSILKSRDITNKGLSSQSYGFSSSHVWM